MDNATQTYSIFVSSELDTALSHAKNEFYPGSSQAEMLQDLIRRGLQSAHSAEQRPASFL